MMEYFKSQETGVVWAYEEGTPEAQREPGLQPMEPDEVEAHLNPALPPITVDGLKEAVTAFRWEVETGGIGLPGGIRVATGIDDQNRITTVVANARLAALETVKFKAASGWVTLTLSEIEAIAAAVALHVQQCFSAECAHHEAIDALVVQFVGGPEGLQAALEAYDETQGWPEPFPV